MAVAARPKWIAKMYPGKTGRDHLWLGSVSSDQILPSLAPGINILTIHPRYHSFYTFLLDEFWRRDLPRTHASFAAFYRPREFIYSLDAHLCDRPLHSVTGCPSAGRCSFATTNTRRTSADCSSSPARCFGTADSTACPF
jgi:hypothetical protein